MPVIEKRLAAGVAMDDIISVLHKSGININKATLSVYLSRFRKSDKAAVQPASEPIKLASSQPKKPKKEITFPDMTPEMMEYYEELGKNGIIK